MMTAKKLEAIEKTLGLDTVEDLRAAAHSGGQSAMSTRITVAQGAIKQAQEELEANPKYQELKESMKALQSSMNEVKKRQNAITAYCLHLLEDGA